MKPVFLVSDVDNERKITKILIKLLFVVYLKNQAKRDDSHGWACCVSTANVLTHPFITFTLLSGSTQLLCTSNLASWLSSITTKHSIKDKLSLCCCTSIFLSLVLPFTFITFPISTPLYSNLCSTFLFLSTTATFTTPSFSILSYSSLGRCRGAWLAQFRGQVILSVPRD